MHQFVSCSNALLVLVILVNGMLSLIVDERKIAFTLLLKVTDWISEFPTQG